METDKCRALLCAMEEGTISGAAEQLGYTVSGVSKMIASLEQETGLLLVHRGKKGVLPTQECLLMMPYMKQLVSSADSYTEMADELKGIHKGKVRIGTSYQNYFKNIVQVIADFTSRYSEIQVKLVEATSSRLYEMLREDSIDLCVASKRETDCKFTEIGQDEIMVWLPAESRYLKYEAYPIEMLEKESYIDICPDEETDNSLLLKSHGIKAAGTYATSEIYAALSMVEAGLGAALINRILADHITGNVITLPLKPRQYIQIGIAEKKEISPAAKKFKEYLLKAFSRCQTSS